MAHILCILALLCFVSCVAENKETEHRFKDLQLKQDSFSLLYKLLEVQESTKEQNLVDLLYKLYKSENGIILQEPGDTEKREENRRGLDDRKSPNRRAGCRIFFWKSWTSC